MRYLQQNRTPRSLVYVANKSGTEVVIKVQPKTLNDNEEYALRVLSSTGYTPRLIERIDHERIAIEYIASERVTDVEGFMSHLDRLLHIMEVTGIRHGDLTPYSVLVRGNQPVIVDWAESRMLSDPRPDKRPEGDRYWLTKTMEDLCRE